MANEELTYSLTNQFTGYFLGSRPIPESLVEEFFEEERRLKEEGS